MQDCSVCGWPYIIGQGINVCLTVRTDLLAETSEQYESVRTSQTVAGSRAPALRARVVTPGERKQHTKASSKTTIMKRPRAFCSELPCNTESCINIKIAAF